MREFRSSFIGYPSTVQYMKFQEKSDSLLEYNQSLLAEGPNWEYATTNVDYYINSFGHRSKELSDLNLNNYILFTGCSFTEGVGVPVEKRYSDVLASMLGTDVYNLALSASGNDILFYNLVSWFNTVKTKPKLVMIQWASDARFMMLGKIIRSVGPWNENYHDFLSSGDEINYFHNKTELLKQMIRKIIDVPIIEVVWHPKKELPFDSKPQYEIIIKPECVVDLARDRSHPGIKSNKIQADLLFDYIKNVELL